MLTHKLIGAGTFVVGGLMAWGASGISGEAGYAGIGPNFLPWVVALALMGCGAFLIYEASTGGFRQLEPAAGDAGGPGEPGEPGQAPGADWPSLAWVAAGIAANALLLTRIGFILSCTVCFVLAVRGLRQAEGRPHGGLRGLVFDVASGALISAPAFWTFTKLLGVNLPGLTAGGWL